MDALIRIKGDSRSIPHGVFDGADYLERQKNLNDPEKCRRSSLQAVADAVLVLLVHPGGPFWRRRDLGAWSVPKGEYETGEEPEAAAYREFMEETGYAPQGVLHPLGELRQRSGKIVTAFATAGDFDAAALLSNTFEMEWPPGSGRIQSFPEVDRAEWFTVPEAREKIVIGQQPFLDRLEQLLATRGH